MSRIEVVCTDERQHHRTSIGWFSRTGGGQWECQAAIDVASMLENGLGRARKGVFRHEGGWSFKCGNCRKYVHMSDVDAQRAMTSLVNVAVHTLDASLLVRILSTRARARDERQGR